MVNIFCIANTTLLNSYTSTLSPIAPASAYSSLPSLSPASSYSSSSPYSELFLRNGYTSPLQPRWSLSTVAPRTSSKTQIYSQSYKNRIAPASQNHLLSPVLYPLTEMESPNPPEKQMTARVKFPSEDVNLVPPPNTKSKNILTSEYQGPVNRCVFTSFRLHKQQKLQKFSHITKLILITLVNNKILMFY